MIESHLTDNLIIISNDLDEAVLGRSYFQYFIDLSTMSVVFAKSTTPSFDDGIPVYLQETIPLPPA